MNKMKPTYNDLLKLFFRIENKISRDTTELKSVLSRLDDKNLKRVQKFIKHVYFQDEKEIFSATDRFYGMLPENRFFKEEIMLAEIADLFSRRRITIDKLAENIQAWSQDEAIDFDILAYGEKAAVVINLYSSVEMDEIDEFLEDLNLFKTFF